MRIIRRKTKAIKVGNFHIGGGYPISIQSMAKAKTSEAETVIKQIGELQGGGCEIVRLAIKDSLDIKAIKKIKQKSRIPLVADIHFNWRLAVEAIDNGIDKIRLNPGNIYKRQEIKEVVTALKQAKIPLRIGLNSGSVKDFNYKKMSMPDKLVENCLNYIKMIERFGFYDIVISLKCSNALDTIEAYRKISKLCDYPLHLGVTATGSGFSGAIKSGIAIGALLLEGIGDTVRVSLTEKPVQEVITAKAILEALNIRHFGHQIISCPTCGRCEVDLLKIVQDLESRLSTMNHKLSTRPMKLAVMGCVVNGPGEAKGADMGVAFGRSDGLLFKKGKAVRKVDFKNCVEALLKELKH